MSSRPVDSALGADRPGLSASGGPVVLPEDRPAPDAVDQVPGEQVPVEQVPAEQAERERFRWTHLLLPLGAFLASRVLGHAAAVLAAWIKGVPTNAVLGAWDGRWYLRAALEGYPSVIGPGDFYRGDVVQVQSTIPFFPLYPALSRGVMEVTGVGVLVAEELVTLVAGAAAVCLVWALARDVYDRQVADRAAVLFAFAPGAVVLSMLYVEGLAIALIAGSILLLRHRQWVLGGVVAAFATATRPNALVLVGVCVWMAGVAVYRRREWTALAAPVLAPLGAIGYFTYLRVHTGQWNAWFDVQRRGWGERTDFGVRSVELAKAFVLHPFTDPYVFLYGITLVVLVPMAALFFLRPRPPAELTLFVLGAVGLSLSSATLNLRPRFLFFAFPLVIVLARWLHGRAYAVVVGASAASMGMLGVFYFLERAYYP